MKVKYLDDYIVLLILKFCVSKSLVAFFLCPRIISKCLLNTYYVIRTIEGTRWGGGRKDSIGPITNLH